MPQTDRTKCLLVDDVEENLIALEALLQRDGLDILKAPSGPEALELLLAHDDVALALLDVQIRAIMLQHAEDCKRMSHADAGRLAMASLREVQALQSSESHSRASCTSAAR